MDERTAFERRREFAPEEPSNQDPFGKGWFDADLLFDYCQKKTASNAMVWMPFDFFESIGIRLSSHVLEQAYECSSIEETRLYAACMDLKGYCAFAGIEDLPETVETYRYYFFYAIGKLDGSRMGALGLYAKDKAVGKDIRFYGESLCVEDVAEEFYDVLLANEAFFRVPAGKEGSIGKEQVMQILLFCDSRMELAEFIKSFEGTSFVHDTLDEDVAKLKELGGAVVERYVSMMKEALEKESDSSEEDEEDEEFDEEDEEFDEEDEEFDDDPFGERTVLLKTGGYTLYFDSVQVEDDGESASIFFELFNDTDKTVGVRLVDLEIDEDPFMELLELGQIRKKTNDYLSFTLNGIDTDVYYDLSFSPEITDEQNGGIVKTDALTLRIDFYDHTATVLEGQRSLYFAREEEEEKEKENENESRPSRSSSAQAERGAEGGFLSCTEKAVYGQLLSTDRIVRVRAMEKAFGIEDLSIVAYVAEGVLYVVGQIKAERIEEDLLLKCTVYDGEGDMIDSIENLPYGGEGLSVIRKNAFFNGLPFKFEKKLKRNENVGKLRIIVCKGGAQ